MADELTGYPPSLTDPEKARAARDAYQAEMMAQAEQMLQDPTPEDEPWAEIGLTLAAVYLILHDDDESEGPGIFIWNLNRSRRKPLAEALVKLEPHIRQYATRKFNAQQEAMIEQAQRLFPRAKKKWTSKKDDRVRETHQAAHGQTVSMREPFRVGMALLPYPGYEFGPPEEVENCRCVISLVLP